MAINFGRARGHSYTSPPFAGEFVVYMYELYRNASQDVKLFCRTRTANTVRQRLSYGRQFLMAQEGPDCVATLEPFVAAATHTVIILPVEMPGVVVVRAQEAFTATFGALLTHPLISFFAAVDMWLRTRDVSPQFTKRWHPSLDEAMFAAVEKFLSTRKQQLPICNNSAALTILSKT